MQTIDESPDTLADLPEEPDNNKPNLVTIVILLLHIVAMLTSLIWPLVRQSVRYRVIPTPTPLFLQEA